MREKGVAEAQNNSFAHQETTALGLCDCIMVMIIVLIWGPHPEVCRRNKLLLDLCQGSLLRDLLLEVPKRSYVGPAGDQ